MVQPLSGSTHADPASSSAPLSLESVDIVAACRAFTAVAAWGSFTSGAAAARIPQSVASRRVAALEQHFGGKLLHRTSRTVQLTPFGRAMLPSAQRLLDAEDAFALDAERAAGATCLLALPAGLPLLAQAQVVRAASSPGMAWDVVIAPPARRAALVATGQVRAAVVSTASPASRWCVPLGLAGRPSAGLMPRRLSDLRPSRADAGAPRRVWVDEEDEVDDVRGPLSAAASAGGLLPSQVRPGGSLTAALAAALDGGDAVLASAAEADRWGLAWRELEQPPLARGYDLAAADDDKAAELLASAGAIMASALGAGSVVGAGAHS